LLTIDQINYNILFTNEESNCINNGIDCSCICCSSRTGLEINIHAGPKDPTQTISTNQILPTIETKTTLKTE